MYADPSARPSLRRRVYRKLFWIPQLALAVVLLVGALYLLIHWLASLLWGFSIIGSTEIVVILVSCVVVGAALLAEAIQTYLVVAPEAIEYTAPGYSIRATWDDVDHIWSHWYATWRSWYWKPYVENLILRRSELRANRWVATLVRFSGSDRIIPVGRFAWDWRNSELGENIRHYAPHLNIRVACVRCQCRHDQYPP